MIVIDTNVVSELFRPLPDPRLAAWFRSQRHGDMFLTSVTIAELASGLHRMPEGEKKVRLAAKIAFIRDEAFSNRILAFDWRAADCAGQLHAKALGQGLNISWPDAQIAGIAKAHSFAIATRNTKDFLHTGVKVIDPWAG